MLHKELNVKKKFADWIKERINKYEFTENEAYKFFPKKGKTSKQGGRPTDDYSLAFDVAKELSMVENECLSIMIGVSTLSSLICKKHSI